MGKIQVMSTTLANKIAAGEVVERPSSVVKELVENAIDAKATKIDIILEEAGLTSIRIVDNGSGMDPEDALMAFKRHATSKLLDELELFRIHTLGFRGEALPSIASVSDVHLTTSTGDEAGIYIHIRGGIDIEQKPSHAKKGTEIMVNNLFYNTPARLKYLKSYNTELGYTIDFINKIALSHSHIAFKLINDQKVLLQTSGNHQILAIIGSIYGLEVAKKMKQASYEDESCRLKLYFSEPEIYRSSRNYVTIVVNDRVVKNYDLVKAIVEGYEAYLPVNKYPIVVCEFTIDPFLIDVNVHPAKLEIRFANNDHIKSIMTNLIRQELKNMLYIPRVSLREDLSRQELTQKEVQQEIDFIHPDACVAEEVEPFVKEPIPFMQDKKPLFKKTDQPAVHQPNVLPLPEETFIQKELEPKKLPKLFYIGQLKGTYLIAQNSDGLYLIDQHAAQERINYEFYLKQLSEKTQESYDLLVPVTFDFSLNESLIIEENLCLLDGLPIQIEKFGLSSFIVTRVPNWFKKNNDKENLDLVFKCLLEQKRVNNQTLFNELAITLSCKRSIKANHFINELEVGQLLTDLERCHSPYTCPHGRPVMIHFTFGEIEHLFKRTV
jgi:DNA mismatch repair protein MutL